MESIKKNPGSNSGQSRAAELSTVAQRDPNTQISRGTSTSTSTSNDMISISPLAFQMAVSAKRAEDRERNLTRSEWSEKAKKNLNQIAGDLYYSNKALHDSEMPKTIDPQLISRAKQATAFINDAEKGGSSVKNPFSSLSREQLSNIFNDDSGAFTVNERQAAWREACNQEESWRRKVIANAMSEYNDTGKLTNFFISVLDHFIELPELEKIFYPTDYVSDLKLKIEKDFNYRKHQSEGDNQHLSNNFQLLLLNPLKSAINNI